MSEMPPYRRRRILQAGLVAATAPFAGCRELELGEGGGVEAEVTPPGGPDVTPGSRRFYVEMREALVELSRPWEQTATGAAEEMTDALERELADLLRPGIRDVLPGDDVQTVVEETVFAFSLLAQQKASFDREQVRADLKEVPGSEIRGYYRDLGYRYQNVLHRPYFPLFAVLIEDLREIEVDAADGTVSSLRSDAETVHTLLDVYVIPRINDHIPDESAAKDSDTASRSSLARTLQLLNQIAHALATTPRSEPTPQSTGTPEETPTEVVYAPGSDQIVKISVDGTVETAVPGQVAKGLTVAPDGTFWTTRQPPLGEPAYIRHIDRQGRVLERFDPNDKGIRGIAMDHRGALGEQNHLYVVAHKNEEIFEFTRDGTREGRYSTPAFEIVGISVDDRGFLWMTNQAANTVYRADISGGETSIVGSWSVDLASLSSVPRVRNNPQLKGVEVVGSEVWVTARNGAAIYRFNRRGELRSRIENVGGRRALAAPPRQGRNESRRQTTTGEIKPTDGLDGYWSFDSVDGRTVPDESGSGHDGTVHGDPRQVRGPVGRALEFDGRDDFVRVGMTPELQTTGSFTLELWMKTTESTVNSTPLGLYTYDGNGQGEGTWINATSNTVTFTARHSSGFGQPGGGAQNDPYYHIAGESPTITPSRWHHVALKRDRQARTIEMYVDGAREFSLAAPDDPRVDDTALTIGARPVEGNAVKNHFLGGIDEVLVYGTALSDERIREHASRNS